MIIHINSKDKVSDVQKAFNQLFPFLKIELFRTKHGYREGSAKQAKLPNYLYFEELALHLPEQFELSELMTVQQLEKLFEEQLGLHVQVFRKSGNLWLETTMTDNWTLKQQNDHGMEISLTPVIPQGTDTQKENE